MSTVLAEPAAGKAAVARPAVRPVVLLILDGFGCREAAPDNAIANAAMPHWRHLLAVSPHTTIDASEKRVGLPEGQMGNSEVGHLNIGAGRVVYQDFTRIDRAIETGEFAANPALAAAVGRRTRAAVARCTCSDCCRPAACTATSASSRRWSSSRRRTASATHPGPRLSRRPRHAAEERGAASLAYMDRGLRQLSRRAHRVDRRPLLRDGPRPALGARRSRLRPARATGGRRYRARSAARGAGGGLCARRDRRVRASHGDPRRRRRPGAHGRRRRGGVHELPRRPRAADDACDDRPRVFDGFVRAAGAAARVLRLPHVATATSSRRCQWRSPRRRFATASANTSQAWGSRSCASPRPRSTRTSRISSTAASKRRIPGEDRVLVPSPKVATYDLQPEMSAVEVTDKLVDGDRIAQVRRHRLQLRERRHGRPHRQLRGRDRSGGNPRRLPRARRGRRARGRRRGA